MRKGGGGCSFFCSNANRVQSLRVGGGEHVFISRLLPSPPPPAPELFHQKMAPLTNGCCSNVTAANCNSSEEEEEEGLKYWAGEDPDNKLPFYEPLRVCCSLSSFMRHPRDSRHLLPTFLLWHSYVEKRKKYCMKGGYFENSLKGGLKQEPAALNHFPQLRLHLQPGISSGTSESSSYASF